MKTFKRYYASDNIHDALEDVILLGTSIKQELESLDEQEGVSVELYEVTFKLIKAGKVTISKTTTLK